ncbi:MAG: hypothetical protein L3K52_15380 [Candidatus Thiothrix sulfatifontis]|nr:MAG: hypothetical protein L3K52_15380 [Candidatus Thiothrix sulfatifontis]
MKNDNNFNAGLAYSDYKTRKLFYMLAAFVAFAMSSYFVVGYLAGHLRVLEWDGSQWMNGLVAIGITAVMTGYQFILYGAGNVAGGKKATILAVVVAVSFSMLSEVGQGMERDNIRMETKSQESPTYKAIVGAISTPAGANPYSADMQAAEVKLAQCETRLAQGKEKHCEGSKARVEAVNKMIANHAATSQQQALALAATAKTMEKDESNYHPLVNLLRETFGASGTVGSFLVSLTLIAFFEYAFHYLGGQFAAAREYLMAHGYDVTRNLRQPPRKFDGSISTYSDKSESAPMAALNGAANSAKQTVGEYAAKIEEGLKASPEVIATEYARAQHAREQSAAMMGDKLQAVGDKIEAAINPQVSFLKLLIAENQARVNHGMEANHENVRNTIEYVLKRHQQTTGNDTSHADVNKLTDLVMKHLKPSKPEVAERHHLYCTLANGRKMDKVFKAHEADAALKEWQRLNKTGIGEDGNPITMLGLHQTHFETEKEAEAFEKKIEAENLKWQSDAPVIKSVTGFKQSADQAANVSRLYQAETAKHEAGEVFNQSPTPAIKRQSVAETIHALVDAVKKSGATTEADIQAAVFDGYSKLFNPADLDDGDLLKVAAKIAKSSASATPAPVMPLQQRTGATGLHNPALGTAEAVYPLPLPTALHARVEGLHAPNTQPLPTALHARVEGLHAPNTQPVLHAPHARVGGEVGRFEVGSIEAYEAADSANIGSRVGCPQCGAEFVKRNQQHRFCCKDHRFAWHNERDPKRQEFINSRKPKAI